MSGLRDRILTHLTEDCDEGRRSFGPKSPPPRSASPKSARPRCRWNETVVTHLAEIFAHVTGRGIDDARQRYAGPSQMLVMLVKAVAMRTSQCGPASPALAPRSCGVIDRHPDRHFANDNAEG